ncbi:MAG: PACE efflux transporter [Paracoccaceae bacterium]
MTPVRRRIVYAVSYESIGVVLSTAILIALSGSGLFAAGTLSVAASAIALVWNVAFNSAFEAWERRQPRRGRPARLRVAHAVLYETGLTLILVPVVALWLNVPLAEALLYDMTLVAFFGVYTFVFTWAFDRVFGLPDSAR